MDSEVRIKFSVLWGSLELMPCGGVRWHPNLDLKMSADEQFRENQKNGHFKGRRLVSKYNGVSA